MCTCLKKIQYKFEPTVGYIHTKVSTKTIYHLPTPIQIANQSNYTFPPLHSIILKLLTGSATKIPNETVLKSTK